jgi:activating signal cointegrator 1
MNALSLSPPYGTLIQLLLKRIETRGWAPSHRGPLAIHQTAAPGPKGTTEAALWDLCSSEPFRSALASKGVMSVAQLPRGKIVAVVKLKDCRIIGRELNGDATIAADDMRSFTPILGNEVAFGDYSAGRFAWLLADVRPLAEPIAVRGMPGLWHYEGVL